MHIYTAETAFQSEESTRPLAASGETPPPPPTSIADETSVAHFCAFVAFYTGQCDDPFSTSMACEKQAEALRITPEDLTPETMQQVIQTMLAAIDHLEKKWLDEQIRHDERKQRHRADVARLYQQLRLAQTQPREKSHLYQKGMQWLSQQLFPHHPARAKRKMAKAPGKPALLPKEAIV